MDENDKMSWRSAIKGLKVLGEKLLKEDRKSDKEVVLPPMRRHELGDIKRAMRFAKKLIKIKTED